MNVTHSGGLIKGRTAFELLRLRYRCTTVATLRNELKGIEQRDPYLGRVIRKPGEEYLQRADFLAIIQVAKEEAERLPQPAGSSSSTSSPGGGE